MSRQRESSGRTFRARCICAPYPCPVHRQHGACPLRPCTKARCAEQDAEERVEAIERDACAGDHAGLRLRKVVEPTVLFCRVFDNRDEQRREGDEREVEAPREFLEMCRRAQLGCLESGNVVFPGSADGRRKRRGRDGCGQGRGRGRRRDWRLGGHGRGCEGSRRVSAQVQTLARLPREYLGLREPGME